MVYNQTEDGRQAQMRREALVLAPAGKGLDGGT
jgi:hypothetical protein